jgi:hypothetical protein
MHDDQTQTIIAGPSRNALLTRVMLDEIGLDNFGVFFTENNIFMGRIYNFNPDRNDPKSVTIEGYYTMDIDIDTILAVKKYDLATDAQYIPPPD